MLQGLISVSSGSIHVIYSHHLLLAAGAVCGNHARQHESLFPDSVNRPVCFINLLADAKITQF